MNTTAIFLVVVVAYVIGPIYIGWTITLPKTHTPEAMQINIFYAVIFIMFFILGVILKHHLGK